VIALVAITSVGSITLGAGRNEWEPRACGDEAGALTEATGIAAPVDPNALHFEAWFRLDPKLDRRGALQGQRLALGIDGERSSRVVDLPPESFAAGPFGRTVLVGTDDGVNSRLEAMNVADQCSWGLAIEADVIRRATIDPAGQTVYEMRVDRATRRSRHLSRPVDGTRLRSRSSVRSIRTNIWPDVRHRVQLGPGRRRAGRLVLRRGRLPDARHRSGDRRLPRGR
jgi:hypothetical protein